MRDGRSFALRSPVRVPLIGPCLEDLDNRPIRGRDDAGKDVRAAEVRGFWLVASARPSRYPPERIVRAPESPGMAGSKRYVF